MGRSFHRQLGLDQVKEFTYEHLHGVGADDGHDGESDCTDPETRFLEGARHGKNARAQISFDEVN